MLVRIAIRIQIGSTVECNSVLQDVTVVRNHVHWNAIPGNGLTRCSSDFTGVLTSDFFDQSQFKVTRNRTIQQTEAIFTSTNIQRWLEQPVGGHHVAEETIQIEDVEPQLTFLIPGFISNYQVYVIVTVTPASGGTRREAQVNAVIDCFVTTILTTVVVHHRRVAFVDVLRGEIEHMVMEPMRAHDFTVITTDIDQTVVTVLQARGCIVNKQGFTGFAGKRSLWIGG